MRAWLRHARRRGAWKLVALLVGPLVVVGALALWLAREPRYGGRTLREWEVLLNSPKPEQRAAAIDGLRREGRVVGLDLAREVAVADSLGRRLYRRLRPMVPDMVHRRLRWMIKEEDRIRRQATALRALGQLEGDPAPETLDAIRVALHHDHILMNLAAMDVLRRVGVAGLPVLAHALQSNRSQARLFACEALAGLGTNAAATAPLLAGLVETGGPDLQAKAATALARVGPGGIDQLVAALSSTNQQARLWAAYGVGMAGPDGARAASALADLVRTDRHPATRQTALRALVKVDRLDPDVGLLLMDLAADPDDALAVAALEGIADRPRLIREHLGSLEALLAHPSAVRRGAAARALGQGGRHAASAVPKLRLLATDTNALASQPALHALRMIGPVPDSKVD